MTSKRSNEFYTLPASTKHPYNQQEILPMGFYPSWNCQPDAHSYASVGQEQAWVVFDIQLKPLKGKLQESSLN